MLHLLSELVQNQLPLIVSYYQAGGHLVDNYAVSQYALGRAAESLER